MDPTLDPLRILVADEDPLFIKEALMERHGIDEREAFDMLRTEARHSNRKLVEIAEAVLTSHRLLPRRAGAMDPIDVGDHPSTS